MESYTQHIIHTLANTLPYIHTKRIERMVRKTKARYASTWRVYKASQHPRSGRIFSHDLAPSAYSATYNADKHTQHTLAHCKYIYIHIYTINVHLVSATIYHHDFSNKYVYYIIYYLHYIYACIFLKSRQNPSTTTLDSQNQNQKSPTQHTGRLRICCSCIHLCLWCIDHRFSTIHSIRYILHIFFKFVLMGLFECIYFI